MAFVFFVLVDVFCISLIIFFDALLYFWGEWILCLLLFDELLFSFFVDHVLTANVLFGIEVVHVLEFAQEDLDVFVLLIAVEIGDCELVDFVLELEDVALVQADGRVFVHWGLVDHIVVNVWADELPFSSEVFVEPVRCGHSDESCFFQQVACYFNGYRFFVVADEVPFCGLELFGINSLVIDNIFLGLIKEGLYALTRPSHSGG